MSKIYDMEWTDEARVYGVYAALECFADTSDGVNVTIPIGEIRSMVQSLKEVVRHVEERTEL